jgi:serine protease AprX
MKSISWHRGDVRNFLGKTSGIQSRLLWLTLLLVFVSRGYAQTLFEQTAPHKYRIVLTDKENNPFSLQHPEQFLSQAALTRRAVQGIPLTTADLPVTPSYLDSIRQTGVTILTVSKWFNAVTVQTDDSVILKRIAEFPFVVSPPHGVSRKSATVAGQSNSGVQISGVSPAYDYGSSEWQTAVHHGDVLHSLGYTGKDVTIAIIDAGFYHVDRLPAFEKMRSEGRILGTRDFVNRSSNLYDGHTHGMVVLSIIGGYLPGELVGTAPDASFWLLRSEDTGSEYPIEEDNWACAAEFADSAGADIINTSLGYSTFDDPALNHTYADMDGNTTRISRAADMAVARGMVVVVSAGNQGGTPWHYISAPADADSVLSVAAMNADGVIASFSSRGPSSDGRVKPDVTAVGQGTWLADPATGIRQGNGTSLSAPVITGLAACLRQALPAVSAATLVQAVRESSDRFTRPDSAFGYGIPDMALALYLAGSESAIAESPVVFPNPFEDLFYIVFQHEVNTGIQVVLTDLSGRMTVNRYFHAFPGRRSLRIDDLGALQQGMYLLKVTAPPYNLTGKLLKF